MSRIRRAAKPPTRGSDFARRDLRALGTMLDRAVALAREFTQESARGDRRIFPDVEGGDLAALLAEPIPRRGLSAARLLADLRTRLVPYLRDNGNPRFFGYVMSPASAAGIAADLITSALDQNVTAWRSSPGATEMERLVVKWMCRIVGFPAGAGGLLTSGGSLATFTALAVARTRHAPAAAARSGLGRLKGRMMTLYMSEEGHMSVPRAAQLLGLGTEAVRVVPVDASFRIDTRALDRAIRADRRDGHLPFCVVASAGTVNTGAVDSLREVARVARRHRLWMHVDAAYGGPLGLSSRYRRLLAGVSEADSVALDPHKWLYAPLDAGCVLFRDGAAMLSTFATHGEYAAVLEPGERESFTFFDHGPELSRRFRALKVWMILKYHGADRIARRIEEDIALARRLAVLARAHEEIELMAPVATSIVCLRYVPRGHRGHRRADDVRLDRLNQEILAALQRSGRVYLSNARLNGRFALRACLINFRTGPADVEAVIEEIVAQGRRLAPMPVS